MDLSENVTLFTELCRISFRQMLGYFILIFCGIYLSLACKAKPKSDPQPLPEAQKVLQLKFQMGKDSRNLTIPGGEISQSFSDSQRKILATALPLTEKVNATVYVGRRSKVFQNLFIDERDPYTGKLLRKSKCLQSIKEFSVDFMSGPGVDWSNCQVNPEKIWGRRVWKVCPSHLWEVTIQQNSPMTQPIELICLE